MNQQHVPVYNNNINRERSNDSNGSRGQHQSDIRGMAFDKYHTSIKETFTKESNIIPRDVFSFGMFDRWLDVVPIHEISFERYRRNDYRHRKLSYRLRFRVLPSTRDTIVYGVEGTKEDQAYQIIRQLVEPVSVQMDTDQTDQGDKIVTDTTSFILPPSQTLNATIPSINLDSICDPSGPTRLPIATNKMEHFKTYDLTTDTKVGTLATIMLPGDLHQFKSAVTTLNKNFAYSKPIMEFEISTTAVAQGCGALVVGSIPDPFQNLEDYHNHPWTTYQRNKALDPNGNGGVLQLNGPKTQIIRIDNPFRNNFVRNATNAKGHVGVMRGQMSALLIQVLDVYKVGLNVPKSIKVTVRYRFVDNPMYALTYTQGLITEVAEIVVPEIAAAEKLLKRAGIIVDEDKPYMDKVIINRPLAINHFSASVGISNATPLAMDPLSTTTLLPKTEMPFETTMDIARIDGIDTKLAWKKDDKQWTILMDKAVNPSIIDKKELEVDFVPTPLCAMANCYNYWTGEIIYTFTILTSEQHTGALMATVQYATPDETTEALTASHTTTFALSSGQNSFEVPIEYKYDTMMRRNNIVFDYPLARNNGVVDVVPKHTVSQLASKLYTTLTPLGLFARSRTRLTLSVAEPLLGSELLSSAVSILVSCRAGSNFKFHELVASQLIHPYSYKIPDGKMDYYTYGKFPSMALNKYSSLQDPVISATGHIDLSNIGTNESTEGMSIPATIRMNKSVPATNTKTAVAKFIVQGEGLEVKNTNDEVTIKNILRSKVRVASITVPPLIHKAVKQDSGTYGREEDTLMRLNAIGRPCNIYGDIRQWFILPVFPLNQRDMRAPFNTTCAAPSALLGTVHRHFSGDIRVTVNVKTATDKPVYISKLPNGGFNFAGIHRVYLNVKGMESHADESWVKCGTLTDMLTPIDAGYRTTVITQKINPWGEITFMDSNNLNRLVTGRRVRDTDDILLVPRNETDNILGHLVICCEDEVDVDIFYEYGDRAELSSFMGFPSYKQVLVKLPSDDFLQSYVHANRAYKVGFQIEQVSDTTKLVPHIVTQDTKSGDVKQVNNTKVNSPEVFDSYTLPKSGNPWLLAQYNYRIKGLESTELGKKKIEHARNEFNASIPHLNVPNIPEFKLLPQPLYFFTSSFDVPESSLPFYADTYLEVGFANMALLPVFPFKGDRRKLEDLKEYLETHRLNVKLILSMAKDETPDYMWDVVDNKMKALNLPNFNCKRLYRLFMSSNIEPLFWGLINLKISEIQMESAAMAVGTVAGVAAGSYLIRKSTSVASKIETAAEGVSGLMGKLNQSLETAGIYATEARNGICHQIAKLGDTLNGVGEHFTFKHIVSMIIDTILLVKNFDYTNMALICMRWLVEFLPLNYDSLLHYKDKLIAIFKQLFPKIGIQGPNSTEQQSGLVSTTESFAGLILGIVGTAFGVKHLIKQNKVRDYKEGLLTRLTDVRGLSYFTTAMNFVSMLFKTADSALNYIFGLVKPEVAIKKYFATHSTEIAEFIDNVEICTNPLNRRRLKEKKFRLLLWTTTIQANNIKKRIAKINPNASTSILLNWCNQMIKFTEENYSALSCSPICYEPFVICLEGPPGIGKSTIQRQMALNLLSAAGYSTGGCDPTYVRCPGLKHWDDFKDEPCVGYDDWLNLSDSESIKEQVSELYQLKSHANFLPSQANINDKGRPAQPKLVTLLTNNAFPESSLNTITAHKDAVYRRRDVVVRCGLAKPGTTMADYTMEEKRKYNHLIFQVVDRFTGKEVEPLMNWELMNAYLCEKFVSYDKLEKLYLIDQIKMLSGSETELALTDPTDFIINYMEQKIESDLTTPDLYPSHILEQELKRIMEDLKVQPLEGAVTEGLTDLWDSILAFFSTTDEDIHCSHCGKKELVLYEKDKHRLCVSCRNDKSTCYKCLNQQGGHKVSEWTLRGLFTMMTNCYSEFKAFIVNNPQLIMGLIVSITTQSITMAASRKITNSLVQGEPTPLMEEMLKYINIENPGNKVECLHTTENFKRDDFIYNDGFWNALNPSTKTLIAMPYSKCKPNCNLNEKDMLDKYADFMERNFQSGELRSNYLLQQIMDNCRNPDDYENYQLVTPPHKRDHSYRMLCPDIYEVENKPSTSFNIDDFMVEEDPMWKKIFKYLSYGVMAVTTIWASLKLINYFVTPKSQIESSGSLQTRHFLKNKRTIIKSAKTFTQNKEEFKEALDQSIANNYFSIKMWDGDVLMQYMIGVGIHDRVAILPKHYYYTLRDKVEVCTNITLGSRKNTIEVDYQFDEKDFQLADSADICKWTLPKTMPTFKDIRKFIVKEKDLAAFTTQAYILEGPNRKNNHVTEHNIKILGIAKEELINSITESFVATDSLKYTFSKNGACGSLVLLKDTTRPIIAMHFAGRADWGVFSDPIGFGVLLTRELFTDTESISDEITTLKNPEHAKLLFPIEVQVEHCGVVEKPIFNPTKSSILPSKIQKYLPTPLTLPCYLSKKDKGYPHDDSPLFAGCKKHGILTNNFKTSEVEEVTQALWDMHYSHLQPIISEPKKLTIGEAIKGFPVPGYEPIHLNTSMGFPFQGKTLKSDYMDIQRDEHGEVIKVLVEKDVLDRLEEVSKLREKKIRPFLPYIDATKDERKKILKREKHGATRIFCMSSIYSTIPNRQNFLHFSAAYTANRFKLQHAVGVSRNGPEWSRLVGYLAEVSLENIVTLDYSNFGPGYNAMVNAAGHEIITRWTKKYVKGVNGNEMEVLGEEHYNSMHIMGELVYKQYSGGPSGDALTVVKNGLVNELYILLAWKNIMKDEARKRQIPIYEMFKQNVRLVVYGDDLIMSVSDSIKDLFNGVTIQHYFKTKKIVATDALKSGNQIPYTSILEATFLKSGFKPHPARKGMWLAPIDEDTIEETPKWIRSCPDTEAATYQNAEAALRDSFGLGEDKFNQIKNKLNDALIQANLPTILLTWEELDNMFFN
ncbi:hypothetical protein [Hubei picorna-like virus 38]|uniref:hypothetical protein n=1 Tax=Hubei picorna-like virus 38 TaxID=1923118 RepID=UPI00090A8260|nr:hypothetical protein [Hubei picorna-like virus 38]APG77424.1 hypothetical protein [Hubei picorna-like virus 38]